MPFRLTRDTVDGMGVLGIEGSFRLTAEKTLKVLRKNAVIIECILDVLRHDPLYQWTLSPLRTQQGKRVSEQRGDSIFDLEDETGITIAATVGDDTGNKEASRALLGVRGKLSGEVSVEYMVNELLGEAMERRNLAMIFPGWQAWL